MAGDAVFQLVPNVDALARSKQSVKLHVDVEELKIAPTVEFEVGVKVQVVVLLTHAPVNPAKVDPAFGDAVSMTAVPPGKLAEHDDPQLIPDGLEVTVPLPVPEGATVTVFDGGGGVVPRMQLSSWVRAASMRSEKPDGSGVLG